MTDHQHRPAGRRRRRRPRARGAGSPSSPPCPSRRSASREWQALNGLAARAADGDDRRDPVARARDAGRARRRRARASSRRDPFTRELETRLRRTLYRWNHLRVDMVVEPYVDVRKVIRRSGWGVGITEDTIDQGGVVQSHHYEDQLANPEDVEKFRVPESRLDVEARRPSARRGPTSASTGSSSVRMQGVSGWNGDDLTFALWDDIEQLPRHRADPATTSSTGPSTSTRSPSRFTEVRLAELDILEAQGLLGYGADRIHCTGAHTTELPKPGFDPARPRAIDTWTVGRSPAVRVGVATPRSTSSCPPYYARWYARFGLGYFGCCDPLHNRIDSVRKIPNVRKISMSPWAKVDKGAEAHRRPTSSSRASPTRRWSRWTQWVPGDRGEGLRARCSRRPRANGCPVEFTLKDISTCRNDPRRLWEWCAIAERMVQGWPVRPPGTRPGRPPGLGGPRASPAPSAAGRRRVRAAGRAACARARRGPGPGRTARSGRSRPGSASRRAGWAAQGSRARAGRVRLGDRDGGRAEPRPRRRAARLARARRAMSHRRAAASSSERRDAAGRHPLLAGRAQPGDRRPDLRRDARPPHRRRPPGPPGSRRPRSGPASRTAPPAARCRAAGPRAA